MAFEIFFVALFASMCAMVGGLIGWLIVGALEHKGKAVLVRQTAIAAAVAAALMVIPALIFGFGIYTDRLTWPVANGILGGSASGVVFGALITALTAPKRVREFLATVPMVAPFALSNFTTLDVDDDKVLSDGDLGHALKQTGFATAEDQKVLQFMRSNMSEIGHGVGSYTTYNGTTSSSKTVSVISPRDLEGYAEKTFAKYAAWRQ
jgi:hypothetical protein